jgi:hypothetical protein
MSEPRESFDENHAGLMIGLTDSGKPMNVRVTDDGQLIVAGGGGGTSDYNALSNRPRISGIVISGDHDPAYYGLPTATDTYTKEDTDDAIEAAIQNAVLNGGTW